MALTITPDHGTDFEPSGRRRKITKYARGANSTTATICVNGY